MKLPDNTELPFFAYGLFKPGQICFFRIHELVSDFTAPQLEGF